jgi:hypothetical protein
MLHEFIHFFFPKGKMDFFIAINRSTDVMGMEGIKIKTQGVYKEVNKNSRT